MKKKEKKWVKSKYLFTNVESMQKLLIIKVIVSFFIFNIFVKN